MRDINGDPIVKLPSVEYMDFRVKLDPAVRKLYDICLARVQEDVRGMMAEGALALNFVSLFPFIVFRLTDHRARPTS